MSLLSTLFPVLIIILQIVISLWICFNKQGSKSLLYSVLYCNILVGGIVYMLLINMLLDYFSYIFSLSDIPFMVRLTQPLTGEIFIVIVTVLLVPVLYFKHITLPLVRDANFLLNSIKKAEHRQNAKKFSEPKNSFPLE